LTIRGWIDRFCDQGTEALICRQGQGGGVFCYMPTVTLEHAQAFLEQIAQSDPGAEHIVSLKASLILINA
jgi:hypothetical protein